MSADNFPFSSSQSRLYLTYGQTNDRFMHFTGVELRFDEMLFDHLRRHGFECVVFFGHHGCYFFDEASVRYCAPQAIDNHSQSLGTHSLGRRLQRRRDPGTSNSSDVPWCFRDLTRLGQLVNIVKKLLYNQVPTAIVFSDLHIYSLEDQNTQLRQDLNALIKNELGQLPTDNRNILLLNVAGDPRRDLERVGWSDLQQGNGDAGLAREICIGPPDMDEVGHWLFSRYLQGELQVVWRDWDACVRELTSKLKRDGGSLNTLGTLLGQQVLSKESIVFFTGDNMEDTVSARLESLVGMESVKKYIDRKRNSFLETSSGFSKKKSRDLLRLVPLPVDPRMRMLNLHLILTGNPGTGKTTVCRLLGTLYRECGMLPLGHVVKVARQDLVGQYVGSTAPRTRACIERALGGVLFIDDAYSLYTGEHDSYGQEALDTLVEAMTDLNGRLAVVMAGYPDDMERMLTANAGLKDRFDKILEIEDYKPKEMEQIFRNAFSKQPKVLPVDDALDGMLLQICSSIYGNRGKHYANARTLEKIAREMVEKAIDEGATNVKSSHLPKEYARYMEAVETSEAGIVKDLDGLIGLGQVKDSVAALIDRITVEQRRRKGEGVTDSSQAGHFVFSGNPGTGKTTVARMLARQFRSMGLLESPDIHETSATSLLKGYVGQTSDNTVKFLQGGIGKLIFIDEAHQLKPASMGSDFRRDVIDTLVPFSEDNREKCIIVLAGYKEEMDQMLASDPGLKSRFRNHIFFEDYKPSEMVHIFDFFAEEDDMQWPSDLLRGELASVFLTLRDSEGSSFANARTVRNFYDQCKIRHARRVVNLSDEHLHSFSAEDLALTGRDIL